MLHLLVENADDWWAAIHDAGITVKYGVNVSAIERQPWRMRDFVLHDPPAVLWRSAQNVD